MDLNKFEVNVEAVVAEAIKHYQSIKLEGFKDIPESALELVFKLKLVKDKEGIQRALSQVIAESLKQELVLEMKKREES